MTRPDHSARYGAHHRKLRAEWKRKVDAGRVSCARCKQPIVPDRRIKGDGWELDHDPMAGGPRDYNGPVHRACNHGGGPPTDPAGPDPEPTPSTSW